MSTFGSIAPAFAYSSSMCVLGTAVLSSSSSTWCLSSASSRRSSVGIGFPSVATRHFRHITIQDDVIMVLTEKDIFLSHIIRMQHPHVTIIHTMIQSRTTTYPPEPRGSFVSFHRVPFLYLPSSFCTDILYEDGHSV